MKEDVKQILIFAVKCPLSNIRQAAARIELLNSGGAKKVRSTELDPISPGHAKTWPIGDV